jgi:subtilase family serine protease
MFLGLLSLAAASLPAQITQADRVTVQPESTASVRLAGHLPRWANPAADAGPVAAETSLHLTFVLSRAPQLQAAFTQLLADQQDPASPRYHQWLTPEQVGELYGPTQHDIDALSAWLTSRGLAPSEVSPSRIFLIVNGTASAVSAALSTSFHSFNLNGEPRLSTTEDPALPAAFAAIVQSIDGLSYTPIQPMGHGQAVSASSSVAGPRFTNNGSHYVTPGDFATIFDLNAATNSGFTGVGQRVAIIGRSRVVATDITEFEANTGLAANLPTTIVPGAGPDPGYAGGGDESEATMDVQRVLGTARAAQADLVVLPNSGGGIFTAAQYEVNTLNDPIMNISFGECEASAGSANVKSWDSLFSQAASQGISVLVCSMDSGADTCDADFTTAHASQQLSINSICASSYATCAGGTEFADTANPSLYWSSSNSSSRVSALGYIPEGAWNEPGSSGNYVVAAGGGGASIYIAKPSWQTGVGVPADGARDVPDISFPSAEHDAYYGCYALGNGDCASNSFEYFYGTSNAAPAMAGVAALLNQRSGSRQGNLNPTLYRLAANPANGVFHDTTIATSGVSGCTASTPSMCNNSTPSPTALTGGLAGYLLTTGYDLVTGWGSIDVDNLLNALAPAQASTSMTLTASSLAIYTGNSDTFTASVSSTTPGTPTGSVQFFLNGITLGASVALSASGNAVTPAIPFATTATYSITAVYSGDASFAGAKSSTLSLTVSNPGFSIAAAPSALSLSAGAATGNSATLTYTSLGGFSGTITQGCTVTYNGSGLPNDRPTCSFTAATVTLPANSAVTGTITIASTAPGGAGGSASAMIGGTSSRALSLRNPAEARNSPSRTALPAIALSALLLGLLPVRRRRLSLLRSLAMACAIASAAASLSGCGGGSSSTSTSTGPTSPGSTSGSYTISLTSVSGTTTATPAASISLSIQ